MRLFLLTITLCILGCSSEPQAPVLSNSPMYSNDREGFRFVVPDDWKMVSRAELPEAKSNLPRMFIQYQRMGSAKPALMEVCRIDSPVSEVMLLEGSHGIREWKRTQPTKQTEIQGVKGTHHFLNGFSGKQGMVKEIILLERNNRHYTFTSIYREFDESAHDQFKRILDSIVWY